MSVFEGTATGHIDFLEKLEDALCDKGHAWGRSYVGTGNGSILGVSNGVGAYTGGAASVAETFEITATSSTEFSVIGSVSGNVGTATVGTAFIHAKIEFKIVAGSTAFVVGDKFVLNTSPKWSLVRKQGTRNKTFLTSNFSSSVNLWDKTSSEGVIAAGSLPGLASMELYVPSEVTQVVLVIGSDVSKSPDSVTLQRSSNGSDWTTVESWTCGAWTSSYQSQVFDVASPPGSYKYWRLSFPAVRSPGTSIALSSVEFKRSVLDSYSLDERLEWIVSAPGLDGTKTILIGCEDYEVPSSAIYNLNWYAPRNFNATKRLREMLPQSGLESTPLSNQPMYYRVFVNGQRFVMVCRIGSVYISGYCGYGNPYELPSVHPYPMILGGMTDSESSRFDREDESFRVFANPGRYSLRAYYPSYGWKTHANLYDAGGSAFGSGATDGGKVFPSVHSASGGSRWLYRDNIDGSLPLFNCVLGSAVSPKHVWGELDGVYWTTGFNNLPESIEVQYGMEYVCIPDGSRATYQDYFAVRMD